MHFIEGAGEHFGMRIARSASPFGSSALPCPLRVHYIEIKRKREREKERERKREKERRAGDCRRKKTRWTNETARLGKYSEQGVNSVKSKVQRAGNLTTDCR